MCDPKFLYKEKEMQAYGRTSVHDFIGDMIVYRNLVPLDGRLSPLDEIRPQVGLAEGTIPRKSERAYAQVIVHLLRQARRLDLSAISLERLLYIGDTRLNDGTAFANICQAGGWPGCAFIGSERDELPHVEIIREEDRILYLANRWGALEDFDRFCRDSHFPFDERTAVVIDLDKTTLGARGRNDHVIDRARVEAVRRTVDDLLGDAFDLDSFQRAYGRLNQVEFHPFTTDNQDYLAYACLILGSGLYSLGALVEEIQAGRLKDFIHFITQVDGRAGDLPEKLRAIHCDVYNSVRQGDPTPFKTFRYNEYRVTVERMGHLADGATVEGLLADEIVITQELRDLALNWRSEGVLLFALSDKPDEASIPNSDLAARDYQPIHRTETHAVGG
jgi:hypothetical protein